MLTTKLRLTVLFWLWPSLTVTVIVEAPVVFIEGEKRTVPVEPGLA